MGYGICDFYTQVEPPIKQSTIDGDLGLCGKAWYDDASDFRNEDESQEEGEREGVSNINNSPFFNLPIFLKREKSIVLLQRTTLWYQFEPIDFSPSKMLSSEITDVNPSWFC